MSRAHKLPTLGLWRLTGALHTDGMLSRLQMVMVVVVTAMAVLVRMAEVKVVAVAVQTAAKQGQVGPVATGMVQQRRREEKVEG